MVCTETEKDRDVAMNLEKRRQLIEIAKRRGYGAGAPRVLVAPVEFFEGNDDEGSIGCNLGEHPGVAAFADAFRAIENMEGVSGVYLAITEIDETYDGIWPFVDTVYIVTRLNPESFAAIVTPLQPDTVQLGSEPFANPPAIPAGHHLVQIWWD